MAASLSLFARYPLLRSLNNRSATQLAQHSNVARWPVNGYLYRNGERPVMTYFLLRGRLGFETPSGLLSRSISAGDDAASKPLADVPHYRHSARCLTEVECLTVDTSLLDVMLNWGAEPPKVEVREVGLDPVVDDGDWMLRLLQRRRFNTLSPSVLQQMFHCMQHVRYPAGTRVVRQGEPGDAFFVIVDGQCRVECEQPDLPAVVAATLGPGDCFGEDALLSGNPRNASVIAATDVTLLQMRQIDFKRLLSVSWTRRLSGYDASERIAAGNACWLDVRPASEQRTRPPESALWIPDFQLRQRIAELRRDTTYICLCDNGCRSAVAASVLMHHGLDAYSLLRDAAPPAPTLQ